MKRFNFSISVAGNTKEEAIKKYEEENIHPSDMYIEEEPEEDTNRRTHLLMHNISYNYFEKDQCMPEEDEEHVETMIKQGYNQGELNNNGDRGWWKIV